MKKIFLIILIQTLLISFSNSQTLINNYEYWYDNNYNNKVSNIISSPVAVFNLQTDIATTGLNYGLHIFHIRFQDNKGIWSSTTSQFFQKLASTSFLSNNKIKNYEYWIDNNYANKVSTTITSVLTYSLIDSFSMASLNNGLHTFHIRFQDEAGLWSCVASQFFQKLPASSITANNKITNYEYWVDNNYSNKTYTSATAGQTINLIDSLPFASLNNGLHTLHIRFKDSYGLWSSVVSQFFQKLPASGIMANNTITNYEYWIDNNYANKTYTSVTAGQTINLIDSLPFASLNNGLHTLHIRFKDSYGLWSTTLSQFFQKLPSSTNASNNLTAYEYWIDNSYSSKTYSSLTPSQTVTLVDSLQFASITNGLHTLHIRFKDQRGLWSSTLSQFFQKLPSSNSSIPNLVTAYKYWVDMSDTTLKTIYFAVPTNPYNLLTNLDLKTIPKGHRTINFQFKDTLGMWSSVLTDTFVKTPTPFANFYADKYLLCDSGLVSFTNTSLIDADTFKWVFGDGSTSNLKNPTHYFASQGLYHVKLITYDTTQFVSDSISKDIRIAPSPIVNLGTDTAFCQGNYLTLNADNAGCIYTWSTGETTSTINVSTTNIFNVTATSQFGCVDRDTINITINPLPLIVSNNQTICFGGSASISSSGASTYTWSNSLGTGSSKIVSPTTTTTYNITGTSNYGCLGTSYSVVYVNPLPVLTANNATICNGNCTSINASGGISYNWSNGSSSNNLNACPIITTVYLITGTDNNGCTSTAKSTVTVNQLPPIVATSSSICYGESTSISASGGSGLYSWSNGNSSNSITISPSITSNYLVTGIDNNGCINTTSGIVVVNPLPIITANNQTICNGNSTNISASGSSYYTWDNGLNGSTISVSPTITSNYQVTGASAFGCSSTGSLIVYVNQLPIVNTTNEMICTGECISIAASGSSISYKWNSGTISSSNLVCPTNTTTYFVTGTDINNCQNTAESIVTVFPKPLITVNGATISQGTSTSLCASSGGLSYNWSNGMTGSCITLNPTTTTTYFVTGIDNNGCTNSEQAIIKVTAGIHELSELDRLYVYPNPFIDNLNIKFELSQPTKLKIKLVDLLGKELIAVLDEQKNRGLYNLSISGNKLSAGTYYLIFETDNGQVIKKVILMK